MKYWITSERLSYRLLYPDDVTERYYGWLRNPEVNQYLETRFGPPSKEQMRGYTTSPRVTPPNGYLFGIFLSNTIGLWPTLDDHIGNVTLSYINTTHKYADLSYFIGETEHWGHGYATEAIKRIVAFGFDECGLHRIEAGTQESHVASQRVLHRAGFQVDGWMSSKMLNPLTGDTRWEAQMIWRILRNEWQPEEKRSVWMRQERPAELLTVPA